MDTTPRHDLLVRKAELDKNARKVVMNGNKSKQAKKEMIDAINKQHSLLTKSFNGGYSGGGGSNRKRKKG